MSIKAQALVLELKCPHKYGEIEFGPGHKFILLMYADHADHNGKNIWPAVETICNKTGYFERTVWRKTKDLESIGFLVRCGVGPHGTNKWRLPYNDSGTALVLGDEGYPAVLIPPRKGVSVTGVSLTPLPSGGVSASGVIPSGVIPLGVTVTPDLKELTLTDISLYTHVEDLWAETQKKLKASMKRAEYETWLSGARLLGEKDRTLVVGVKNEYARDWLNKNIRGKAENESGYYVAFVVASEVEVSYV